MDWILRNNPVHNVDVSLHKNYVVKTDISQWPYLALNFTKNSKGAIIQEAME